MKTDKPRRRILATIAALSVFVLATLIISPYTIFYSLIWRNNETKRRRFHRIIYRYNKAAIRCLPGVHYSVDNPSGETFEDPCVIISNHQSHLDLICALALHPDLVVLTNNRVWHNPFYHIIIRYAEFYPATEGFDNLLPRFHDLIRRGYSILIYPEGTRSPDGKVGRFHMGAFSLAQSLKTDILPVYIHGACNVMPKKEIWLRKGDIRLEIGHRIPATYIAEKEPRKLASELHHRYETKIQP